MDILFWFVMLVVFIAVEAGTVQFVSLWFAIGSVVSIAAALFQLDFWLQVAVFAIVSLVCLLILRPVLKNKASVKRQPTNADRYVGQNGIVVQDIDNDEAQGQVKVLGNVWTARSADGVIIQAGEKVSVNSINGVKLIVSKL